MKGETDSKESVFFIMNKLKALIYQQKEWDPHLLSTGYPAFPVENISKEALGVWKLQADEVLLIAATDASVCMAQNLHMAVAAYSSPEFPGQQFPGVWMVIEGFEEIDDGFLERIFLRCHNLPWEIARTDRCIIRELTIEDLPALEKLYEKEGVSWRKNEKGEKIPGFIEPLFPYEEEKEYQQAYISNMYRYYGYGMWLIFDKATQQLIGRAGLEHREFAQGTELELGYVIDPDRQGQGLATEVCTAILAFAREELDFSRVNALTDAKNAASIALLHKLGFRYLEETDVSGDRTHRYIYEFS